MSAPKNPKSALISISNQDYETIRDLVRAVRGEARARGWSNDPKTVVGLSVEALSAAIRNRSLSSEEAVAAYLERICEVNPALNAVVTLDAPGALARAREADAATERGVSWGALHGVPFTIKDTFRTKGIRTTGGYLPLADFVPDENAVVVQRLIDAGAVLMGKTNTPALAMDMQTSNDVFGTTQNAHGHGWTAGGSSGGSSVAVAAKMTAFDFGTDLAGSIRLPAAFNGVYGLRPTFGLVSMRGHVPPRPDELDGIRRMATAGPIARTLSDLSLLLGVVGGPGKGDRRLDPVPPAPDKKPSIRDLRVAWTDRLGDVPVSRETAEALEAYVRALEAAGARVTKAQPADFPYVRAWETWGAFVGAQGGYERGNWTRRMGEFFTRKAVAKIPMQRKIVGPITVPGYMEAMKNQDECIERLETFLDDFDVWLVPVSSTAAFEHQKPTQKFGEFFVYDDPLDVDGAEVPYYVATQSYTTIFSLTESPVAVLPIGQDRRGAPLGVQAVGRRFGDLALVGVCQTIDRAAKGENEAL